MSYRVERHDPATMVDKNRLRSLMESEGFHVYGWSDAPDAVYPSHSHSAEQSHAVISGSLELRVEGVGRVVLSPGDRDLTPAGTVHSARVIGNEPVIYLIGEK